MSIQAAAPEPAIMLTRFDKPDSCIIRTRQRELIGSELGELLDPVQATTFHEYVLPADTLVELHRHDYDEYWWFTSGMPVVTLWTEATGSRQYRLGPGDMVACVRGMAHTLRADHEVVYFQFSSYPRAGARTGHLTDGVPQEAGRRE